MNGEVRDDGVLLEGPAGRKLLQKQHVGTAVRDGALVPHLEAIHLAEQGRVELRRADAPVQPWELALEIELKHPGTLTRLAAYRDVRQRGLLCDLRGDEAEIGPPRQADDARKSPLEGTAVALIEREAVLVQPERLRDGLRRARARPLLAAVVDEEWDVTYYTVAAWSADAGSPAPLRAREAHIVVTGPQAMLLGKDAASVHERTGAGRPVLNGVSLSLVEAAVLGARGIPVGGPRGPMSAEALHHYVWGQSEDLARAAAAAVRVAERGWIPRTGLKYGVHLRLYHPEHRDDHAPWLYHVVDETTWRGLARLVRMAHGVKKRLALEIKGEAFEFGWARKPL